MTPIHLRTLPMMLFAYFPLLITGALALAPTPARAEGFVDLYLGAGFPESSNVHTSADDLFVNDAIRYNGDVDWDETPSFGIRGGYWFDDAGLNFLGIGLDFSYYQVTEESGFAPLDVYAFPMTPLLMLRIPIITSEAFPNGRLQPYGAVGPGLTVTAATADLSDFGIGLHDFEDASFDLGLDARGGLAVQIWRHFAVFAEYKFTYLEPDYSDEVDDFNRPPTFETDIDFDPELYVHHVVFGVSFRF